MTRLTKTYIEKAPAPASGVKLHWDDSVKGYGLRVSPAGKKVFFVQGRVQGRAAVITIGTFGTYTEDQARKRAQSVLQQMRDGIDPRDLKKADEALKVTLQTVCDSYCSRPGKLKDSSKAEIKRHVEKVFTSWKDKPIASITEDGVRKRYREMATKGLTGKPAPGQANISMTTLRALINYAARQYKRGDGTPLIQHNPVEVLRDHWIELEPRDDRYIDPKKIGAVWHMLTTARSALIAAQSREDGRINPQDADKQAAVDLTIFLLLTGVRRDEAATLTWANVNIENDNPADCWFYLPVTKNGNPVTLPLSSQAVALLKSRKRVEGNPYVFTSRGKGGRIREARGAMERVSKVAGKHLSLHDLRRTYSTLSYSECRIDLHKIELLTNHAPKSITAKHYLETSKLQYLHREAQLFGDWIERQGEIAEAKASGANVVSLPKRA